MSKKKKGVFLCIAAGILALTVLLFWIWYAWPRSFSAFGVTEPNTDTIYCLAIEARVREGTPVIDTYRIQLEDGDEVQNVMNLLKDSSYSRLYQNLFPKSAGSFGSENEGEDSVTVSITFLYENGGNNFLFLDNGKGRLMKQDGKAVYFKTDKFLIERLAGYIKEKGIKQEQ